MRRAKFKFPGRQKVVASRNWGFTKLSRDDYLAFRQEGRLVNDGVIVRVLGSHGTVEKREAAHLFEGPACQYQTPIHD